MKIGILGGTFNPIHIGHVYMAMECKDLLELDKVIVMPNGDPPHKDDTVLEKELRLKMARLAFKDMKDVIEVSDLEVRSRDISYTYKTLQTLKWSYREDELYFILGADSLVNFNKWKNPEEILKLVTIVCFDRPLYREEEKDKARKFIEGHSGKIIMIDSLELEISSTDIRNRIFNKKPYSFFLPKEVYDYIESKGLYRNHGK